MILGNNCILSYSKTNCNLKGSTYLLLYFILQLHNDLLNTVNMLRSLLQYVPCQWLPVTYCEFPIR